MILCSRHFIILELNFGNKGLHCVSNKTNRIEIGIQLFKL